VLACCIGAYRLHAGVPQALIILNDTAASQPVSSRSTPAAQAIPASSEPRVARAEMGTDRTDDYQIIGPSTEFYTDTPKIVCVWAVEGVDLGVPIRSVWIGRGRRWRRTPTTSLKINPSTGLMRAASISPPRRMAGPWANIAWKFISAISSRNKFHSRSNRGKVGRLT